MSTLFMDGEIQDDDQNEIVTPFPNVILSGMEDDNARRECAYNFKIFDKHATEDVDKRNRLSAKNIVKLATQYNSKCCVVSCGAAHEISKFSRNNFSLSKYLIEECELAGIKYNVIPLPICRNEPKHCDEEFSLRFNEDPEIDEFSRIAFELGTVPTDVKVFVTGNNPEINQGKALYTFVMDAIQLQESKKKPEDRRSQITIDEEIENAKRREIMEELKGKPMSEARNSYIELINKYKQTRESEKEAKNHSSVKLNRQGQPFRM